MFQSCILSAFPILTFALNPVNGDLCLGFGDGMIRIFDSSGKYAKELASLNIALHLDKIDKKKQVSVYDMLATFYFMK